MAALIPGPGSGLRPIAEAAVSRRSSAAAISWKRGASGTMDDGQRCCRILVLSCSYSRGRRGRVDANRRNQQLLAA
jgi:hypothetical protein